MKLAPRRLKHDSAEYEEWRGIPLTVTLDGFIVYCVTEYDMDKGRVTRFKRTPAGRPIVVNGHYVTETLTGSVCAFIQ